MSYIFKEGLPYLIWKFTDAKKDPFDLRELWMCNQAREFINNLIKKDFRVLEYGGGGSTLFFSDNVQSVDTIETNPNWVNRIKTSLRNNNVNFIQEPKGKYDLILIDDSGNRVKHFKEAKRFLKQTGTIIFDNIDRYKINEKPLYLFKGYSKGYAGITTTGVFIYEK